ncbi:MAG: LuxR C-terminal-related transcriptional regulator [Candidatus Manganitrophaceae bacterium]
MWEKQSTHFKVDEQAFLLDEARMRLSHRYSSRIGVDPGLERLTDILSGAALNGFLAKYLPIIAAARKLFSEVYQLLPDPSCAFVLTDSTGRMIDLFSAPELIFLCAEKGVVPGASLSDQSCGTNAVALALDDGRPVMVKGRQHFCRLFHDWYCVAAPVLDTAGEAVGCVDFSTGHEAGIGEKLPLLTMLAEKLAAWFPMENDLAAEEALHPPAPAAIPVFTSRQMRILAMVARGLTTKEIGAMLAISARTVETHLERMRTRARARTTAQLVALAFHPDRISI